jgi:hypothetical protein
MPPFLGTGRSISGFSISSSVLLGWCIEDSTILVPKTAEIHELRTHTTYFLAPFLLMVGTLDGLPFYFSGVPTWSSPHCFSSFINSTEENQLFTEHFCAISVSVLKGEGWTELIFQVSFHNVLALPVPVESCCTLSLYHS